MAFLHPVFTAVTLVLIGYSFLEVNNSKNYKSLWVVIGIMIILIGFRGVGADYGVYVQMYYYFGQNTPYSVMLNKAAFGSEYLDIEWLYVLIGKFMYDISAPFFIYTFVLAIISIGVKYYSFENSVVYPSLSVLLYMFPSYFTADGGHMRQALAMAIVMGSFYFIKKRNIVMFFFFIYIAMGFHKSAVIFVPAYWLVLVPMNATKILVIVLVSIFLSPFKLYSYISILDTIAPEEVYQGFSAYEMIEESNMGTVKFTDLICTMYVYFMVTYDKEACRQIPYYEYMRNILVIGVCMYFIFRGSPIFSSRLSAYYMGFMTMVLPNVIASVQDEKLKKMLHLFLIAFVVFYYFVFAIMQAKTGYNFGSYWNYLW